jgi:hypothetical protein
MLLVAILRNAVGRKTRRDVTYSIAGVKVRLIGRAATAARAVALGMTVSVGAKNV